MKYEYKRIRDLREDNDYTQKQIADVLETTYQYYSAYERGLRDIPFSRIIKLAKFYDVSIDYIAGLTNEPNTNWTTKNKNNKKNSVSVTNNGSGNITMGNIKQK